MPLECRGWTVNAKRMRRLYREEDLYDEAALEGREIISCIRIFSGAKRDILPERLRNTCQVDLD